MHINTHVHTCIYLCLGVRVTTLHTYTQNKVVCLTVLCSLCHSSRKALMYHCFICSRKTNVSTVWGATREKYGVEPFHKLKAPSLLITFTITSCNIIEECMHYYSTLVRDLLLTLRQSNNINTAYTAHHHGYVYAHVLKEGNFPQCLN